MHVSTANLVFNFLLFQVLANLLVIRTSEHPPSPPINLYKHTLLGSFMLKNIVVKGENSRTESCENC